MKMGKSIRGALSYNEQKVAKGNAELILASNFSRDISDMGFSEKLARFAKLNDLNTKTQTNTLHLSLNFAPGEILGTDTLQRMAADYMERIGFADQPFLVYRHDDAGHPHIHIVTNTIRPNGKAIFLHNLAKRKSEPARKAIEQEYSLVKAEDHKKDLNTPLKPIPLSVAAYGKAETKRTISNIVAEVVQSYKYSSFEQFNAILKQYNVQAYQSNNLPCDKKGLTYSLVDVAGNKVGVPIKASALYAKPTMNVLEKRFQKNEVSKVAGKDQFAQKIRSVLAKASHFTAFQNQLSKYGIAIQTAATSAGSNNPTTFFIDNYRKVVYSAADLGIDLPAPTNSQEQQQINSHPSYQHTNDAAVAHSTDFSFHSGLLKTLMEGHGDNETVSNDLLKKKKRKGRKK